MELYSARILLNGSRDNEVRRDDLTAPEVLILRSMHGGDAVLDVKIVGKIERTPGQERKRLFGVEGELPALYKAEQIAKVFPSEFTPMPEALPPDMVNIEGSAVDLAKATGKAVEDMTPEEVDAELALLDTRRKSIAKARAAKIALAAQAAQQSATLD